MISGIPTITKLAKNIEYGISSDTYIEKNNLRVEALFWNKQRKKFQFNSQKEKKQKEKVHKTY